MTMALNVIRSFQGRLGRVANLVSSVAYASPNKRSEERASKSPAVPHINILGTRGIPAAHGGFETFVAQLAPFLKSQGWSVTVYCQAQGGVGKPRCWIDDWEGIERVHYETRSEGGLATIEFDLNCVFHVLG